MPAGARDQVRCRFCCLGHRRAPPPLLLQIAEDYKEVKRVSDMEMGIPSQCVVGPKVRAGGKEEGLLVGAGRTGGMRMPHGSMRRRR